MGWIQTTTLAAFLGLATASDFRERRVPNRLVAAFTMAALGLGGISDGISGLCWAGGGFAVGLGLLLVPFAMGFVGAGDAKYFGAVGGFLGPRLTLHAFLFGTALGTVAAIVTLRRARGDHFGLAEWTNAQHGAHSAAPRDTAEVPTVPYAVPLGLGAVTAVALDWAGLALL